MAVPAGVSRVEDETCSLVRLEVYLEHLLPVQPLQLSLLLLQLVSLRQIPIRPLALVSPVVAASSSFDEAASFRRVPSFSVWLSFIFSSVSGSLLLEANVIIVVVAWIFLEVEEAFVLGAHITFTAVYLHLRYGPFDGLQVSRVKVFYVEDDVRSAVELEHFPVKGHQEAPAFLACLAALLGRLIGGASSKAVLEILTWNERELCCEVLCLRNGKII